MVAYMMDSGNKERGTDMVFNYGRRELYMKDFGIIIKFAVMVE